jgi:hypothetical protein
MIQFNIEFQYQAYLKRVGLKEVNMHPIQRQETKRAFMGAVGQMLVLLRDDLSELEEDVAVMHLENMTQQVGYFWEKQS